MLRSLLFWRAWGGIVAAILIPSLAAVLRIEFLQLLEMRAPYVTFYPAVVLAAAIGGFIPGLLATVLGGTLASFFWIEPAGKLSIGTLSDQVSMLIFALSCILISGICEYMHRIHLQLIETQVETVEKSKLLDSAHDYIIVRDLDSRILYWNKGAENGYGFSSDEASGKVTHQLLKTEFPVSAELILSSLEEKGHWEGELMHTCKDGRKIIVRSNQTLTHDESGKRVSILEINYDVTQQHADQENLQKLMRDLQEINTSIEEEIMERQKTEIALQQLNTELEDRVRERTSTLEQINAVLEEEIMERQKAEDSLQQERDRLLSLLNSINDEVWFADVNKNFTLANPAAVIEFGDRAETGVEELASSVDVMRSDGSIRPVEEAPPLKALRGEIVKNQEEIIRMPSSGALRHREVSANPVHDANGNIIGAVAVVRDITERKNNEKIQMETWLKLEAALDSMTDAVFISDEKGRLVQFNSAFAKYHRFMDKSECLEALLEYPNILNVFFPDGSPAPADQWVVPRALRGETATNAEYIIQRKDTGERWSGSYNFSPIRDSRGAIIGSVAIARDITEQKQANEALRESEQRYRAVIHGATEAISLVDAETKRFFDVNNGFTQVFGYAKEELRSLSLYDLDTKSRAELDKELDEIVNVGGVSSKIRRIRHKTGKIVEVEWSASVITIAGKRALLFHNRDLSAQRKLQEQILHDVGIAMELQKTILQPDFEDLFVSVKTIFEPCHMVSGDSYDYAWSSDFKRLSGFILDISGHGVASSLQGIAVGTYFRDVLESPMGLDAKLAWINQRVMRYFTDETFAAALFFEFDFSKNVLRFATAGICSFFCSAAELPTEVRQAGSLLGISDKVEYTERSATLNPGDTYYFMSDGLFEQVTGVQGLDTVNFDQTIARLRQLSTTGDGRDDCSAICFRIKEKASYPYVFEVQRYGDFQRLRVRLRELLQQINASLAGRVFVAIGEAINNAARESLQIRLKVNRVKDLLIIRVRDSGKGFDGNAKVNGIRAGSAKDEFEGMLLAEGGRGILIMVSWMDKVIYSRKGNEVLLAKRLTKKT